MKTQSLKHLNTLERREWFRKVIKNGQYFSVEWISDEGYCKRLCKEYIHSAYTLGHKDLSLGTNNFNLYHVQVVEMAKVQRDETWQWLTVNVATFITVVVNKTIYTF